MAFGTPASRASWGTVRDDGEDPDSDRVRTAGGPGWALAYHGAYEFQTPLEDLPGGSTCRARVCRDGDEGSRGSA